MHPSASNSCFMHKMDFYANKSVVYPPIYPPSSVIITSQTLTIEVMEHVHELLETYLIG